MNKIVLVASLIAGIIGLSGCETMRGMGRDVSNVGDALMGN